MSERERFIVSESSGYLIAPQASMFGAKRRVTEVMVLDRDYCHNVVWSSLTTPMLVERRYFNMDNALGRKRWRTTRSFPTARRWSVEKCRQYAAELAARLNSEDEQLVREAG